MELNLMEVLSGGNLQREDVPLDEITAKQLLRDAYAKLGEVHQFKPGQLVRLKRGTESGFQDFRGNVGIFVRHVSGEERDSYSGRTQSHHPGSPLGVLDIDCVIGRLTPDGAMAEHLAASRYLEPAE